MTAALALTARPSTGASIRRGVHQPADRLVHDQQRRHHDQHTFKHRGEVLSLVMAVGMGDIGRFLGVADGNEGSRAAITLTVDSSASE
jgi:hypothetical protein